MKSRRTFIKATVLSAALASMGVVSLAAHAADTIKVGVHRRSEGRRSVQRRLEDARPGPRAAVEPVHRRQRHQEGRAGRDVIPAGCVIKTTGAAAPVFYIASLLALTGIGNGPASPGRFCLVDAVSEAASASDRFDWFAERSATPMLTETPSRPRSDAIVVFATARRSRSAIAIA